MSIGAVTSRTQPSPSTPHRLKRHSVIPFLAKVFTKSAATFAP